MDIDLESDDISYVTINLSLSVQSISNEALHYSPSDNNGNTEIEEADRDYDEGEHVEKDNEKRKMTKKKVNKTKKPKRSRGEEDNHQEKVVLDEKSSDKEESSSNYETEDDEEIKDRDTKSKIHRLFH